MCFFSGIDETKLLEIVKDVKFLKFSSGEKIYDHRSKVDSLDYILSGSIDFRTYQGTLIKTFESKYIFGESLFDSTRIFREIGVFAKKETVLISIRFDMNTKELHLDTFFKIYENVIRSLVDKISILIDVD